jgi:TPR repeat protein
VAFRVNLSRDTGANLTVAACEELLDALFEDEGGEEFTLQSNPGLFYASIGEAIETQKAVVPDHLKVAWFCYREAAEAHNNLIGINRLAACFLRGRGVTRDPAQAAFWYQKAVDLGHACSKAALGALLMDGVGVAQDAVRGFKLMREAVEQGYGLASCHVAQCYLKGDGVEKDAVHAVSLLRQIIDREDDTQAEAEATLTICYMEGNGVEADTVQAALWCQRAATGGNDQAVKLLPIIRRCDFCGTTPARKHCERCRKVRYCNTACQAAHWTQETDPHNGHCRRAAEASQQEAGGASTSGQ